MNAVQFNDEMEVVESVYCPACYGELLLGCETPAGEILQPYEGKVVLEPMPEGASPVVICRDCDFRQVMNPEDVFVYDGPVMEDPFK